MAQLPDFAEVSDGVAEEYLLRLASSIEHARKQSHLRSIVFTGTQAGTGVTTLVNRVGAMLEAMGRTTLLVDASGLPASQNAQDRAQVNGGAQGLVPVERVSRPTALLQQMAEETETQEESLVLTDTAPLAVSAETEYLARFVDCVIVVIQSGKTTRRELREAAAMLQRLDVAAVGFVLNRVGMAKAEPAFRHSVQAIERHVKAQGSHLARRAEMAKAAAKEKAYVPEPPAPVEVRPQEPVPRPFFEPDLAAAAAAVARLSHPAVSDEAACLPTPTVHVAAPESARRFWAPLATEASEAVAGAMTPLPMEETSTNFMARFAREQEQQATITPATSVPMTADRETSASVTLDPVTLDPVPLDAVASETAPPAHVSPPFAEAAKHFSSSIGSDPAGVLGGSSMHSPFADVAEHFASQTHSEPVASSPVEHLEPSHAVNAEHPSIDEAATREDVPETTSHGAEVPLEAIAATPEPEEHRFAAETAAASEGEAAPSSDAQPSLETQPTAAQAEEAGPNANPTSTQAEREARASPMQSPIFEPGPLPAFHAGEPAASDVPWWLSDLKRHPEPVRPPVLWQAAKVRFSGVKDEEPEEIVPEPLPTGPDVKPMRPQPWVAAAHSWDRPSTGRDIPRPEPTPINRHETEEDEVPVNLTSRLSGLRNLLFVMGVKNPNGTGEPGEWPPIPGSNFENKEQAGQTANLQDAEVVAVRGIDGAAPRLVTAPPEFFLRKPSVVSVGREGAPVGESSTRQDRRAAYDGVEILPSRRGQYKKI